MVDSCTVVSRAERTLNNCRRQVTRVLYVGTVHHYTLLSALHVPCLVGASRGASPRVVTDAAPPNCRGPGAAHTTLSGRLASCVCECTAPDAPPPSIAWTLRAREHQRTLLGGRTPSTQAAPFPRAHAFGWLAAASTTLTVRPDRIQCWHWPSLRGPRRRGISPVRDVSLNPPWIGQRVPSRRVSARLPAQYSVSFQRKSR